MRHRNREVVPVRRRRLGFAFALVAALVSGGWNDCCCYGDLDLPAPVGYRVPKQPFPGDAYYLHSFDAGAPYGKMVATKGWEPRVLGSNWRGSFTFGGRLANVAAVHREDEWRFNLATHLGLVKNDTHYGTRTLYSGLPSNAGVWALAPRSQGGFYAGLDSASGAGIPLLYRCLTSGTSCAAVPGGPVSAGANDKVWSIRSFGGAYYASTSRGTWSSPDGNTFFREMGMPTSANYDIAGEDGSLVVTTASGVYKCPGRGGPCTPDNTGLGTSCAVPAYRNSTFYVTCNGPTSKVYTRARTATAWTSAFDIPGYVCGAEVDGEDIVVGGTEGVFRYRAGTWAPDIDPCDKGRGSVLAVHYDGQTLAAGGSLTGFAESTDRGATWSRNSATLRLSAQYIARSSLGTYFTGSTGTRFRASGQTTFQSVTGIPGGYALSLGTAGDTVFAGTLSGGLGKLLGTTYQASNTGFDTTAAVNGFTWDGSTVVAHTNKGNWFSTNLGGSWTRGANRADGQPFVGYSGTPLDGGGFLFGGYLNPPGWNIVKSNASGTSLTPAGAGLPPDITVRSVDRLGRPRFVRTSLTESADAGTAILAATSRGLYVSYDDAASWSLLSKDLGTGPVNGLAVESDRLWVATSHRGLVAYSLPLAFRRLVPIVLDVETATAHYTTELALTNPGTTAADVTLQYTASLGSGSATVSDTLAPGRQLLIPDVIAYLRGKGAAIPVGGSQGGTLLLTFTNVSATGLPAVTARTAAATAAPLPVGRAGLAYAAIDPREGSRGTLTVYGLRSNGTDRSNLAVYNTSGESVTFSVTAFSGDGSGASSVIAAADSLPAWGWKQYNRILEGPGYAQGWVQVTRTSSTGSFGTYGVVNDNVTNDGSLVEAGASPQFPAYTNVPVLVETGAFVSELALANADTAAATFRLAYRESLTGSGGGSTDVTVPAKSQLIVPNAIAYLRSRGVSVGPAGGSYAGSLHVQVTGANAASTWVGARTSAPTSAGGQFGLFTPSAAPGGEGDVEATINGLRADAENRSNVAAVNTGGPDDGSITLSVQAYDGDAGGAARGAPAVLTLAPGQWQQLNNFLGSVGVANGWVKVTRTTGFAPWIAYGVINDGGAPGQRTSDGAFVAMVK